MPTQDAPGAAHGAGDPLAELARLIGQNDPFAEYGQQPAQSAPPPPSQPARVNPEWATHVAADAGYIPPPAAPPRHDFSQPPDLHPAEYAPSAAEYRPGYQPSVPGYSGGEAGYDQESYYPNTPVSDGEQQHYYDDLPPRRRRGVLAIAAVFALAVIGTAGAFGYRTLFGSSGSSGPPPVIKADTAPAKIFPAKKKSADAKNGKLIYDRVADRGKDEKLVSREEQPVDMAHKSAGVVLPKEPNGMPSGSIQPLLGSGVIGGTPRKVHTIAIRPDGSALASAGPSAPMPAPAAAPQPPMPSAPPPHEEPQAPPPAMTEKPAPPPAPAPRHTEAAHATHAAPPARRHEAASHNVPLSLSPNAPASAPAPARAERRPMRTANVAPAPNAPRQAAPAARSGGYAVQVASRHNEADAKASLHSLQAKYGQQLGGHQTLIRRVDLGAKGVYYRAMVGPFGNAEEASRMCSRLKAAGGSCFVQRI